MHEHLPEIGQKNFGCMTADGRLAKGAGVVAAGRARGRAGSLLAAVEGVADLRALVREMYEYYTSVYERSGKKVLGA